MAGPVCKLYMFKYTDAWYQLSEEEKKSHVAKVDAALEKVGGKTIVQCVSLWASEQWLSFGVEEFPDIEAVQQHTRDLFELDHYRYLECTSILGARFEEESS